MAFRCNPSISHACARGGEHRPIVFDSNVCGEGAANRVRRSSGLCSKSRSNLVLIRAHQSDSLSTDTRIKPSSAISTCTIIGRQHTLQSMT